MIDFTPIFRPYFRHVAARQKKWANPADAERVQRRLLAGLIHAARDTAYGTLYGFRGISSYEDFAATVPVVEYEDIRAYVMRMVAGEHNVLWPGVTRRFAQSSGTSGGKSKYIPVTPDGLRRNHYAGPAFTVANYLMANPASRLFSGKGFILGGSFANELNVMPTGVTVGDLSANLIDGVNPLVNYFRIPSKEVALMPDWNEKLPALVEASRHADVTNISGVPSWFMTVLETIIRQTGASTIHDVWPNLEVFFHGGIAFGPYRSRYRDLTDPSRMHYLENYNASEGFFACQDDINIRAMRLLLDVGVFFEFVPLGHNGEPFPDALPAWKVEPGHTYGLVISSCNGLWRYAVGDTVRIQSVEPLRITIAGRTNSFINAFGEELMVWNTDEALTTACRKTGASAANYTAAPVYADGGHKGHHQWLIEWTVPPACGNEAFADILDKELQAVNSDYQAKRSGDIFLARLELTEAPAGLFDRWLASTGKLGGQRKIPRLSNNRRTIDSMLRLASS